MASKNYSFRKISFYCILLSISQINYGYVIGFSSNSEIAMEKSSILNPKYSFIYSSIVNIGALIGGILSAAFLMEKLGRKLTMLIASIFFLCGWTLLVSISLKAVQSVNVFPILIIARLLTGIGLGINASCLQIYLNEILILDLQKTFAVFPTLFATLGLFLCFLVGYLMIKLDMKGLKNYGNLTGETYVYKNSILWVPFFGAIFSFIQLLASLILPESPAWLASKNSPMFKNEEKIQLISKKLYGNYCMFKLDDLSAEHEIACCEEVKIAETKKTGAFGSLFEKGTMKALGLSVTLLLLQNLCGIYALIFNSTKIFRSAGLGRPKNATSSWTPNEATAALGSVAIGATTFIATFFGIIMSNALPRRIHLIVGAIFQGIPLVVLSLHYLLGWKNFLLPLFSMIFYFVVHSVSWGFLPWVVMSELSYGPAAGIIGGLSSQSNWVASFVLTLLYNPLVKLISTGGVFLIYTVFCLVAAIFSLLYVPETKNVSKKDIKNILENGKCMVVYRDKEYEKVKNIIVA